MADNNIADEVQKGLQILATLAEEIHWMCDKVEPSANGRAIAPDEDEASRLNSTMHALMLLSFSGQEPNQEWLKSHISTQLARCSRCVESFYTAKRMFYQRLLPLHGKENLDMFFSYLEDWDIERVKPIVTDVVRELDQAASVEAWFEALRKDARRFNAIHECFCEPTMLRDAELRKAVKRLCGVEQMKITGPADALVTFLFEEDDAMQSLAEKSWRDVGAAITPREFENNLSITLESATSTAYTMNDPDKISRFFRGIAKIVSSVGKDVILKCISGAEKDPIKLAVHRIQPNTPLWPAILRLFQALMHKLRLSIWEVISPLTASAFGDVVFHDRLFGRLLREAEQNAGGVSQLLDLTEWMSEYINSVEPLLRPTTAPAVLRHVFKTELPALSRGLCFKEGMKILDSTLKAVEPEVTSNHEVLVRQANDLFLEYQKLVTDVAFSSQSFEDRLMEEHMAIAQLAAQETVISALKLDVRFLQADHQCMGRKSPGKPTYEMDVRAGLWDIVARKFPLNNVKFCQKLLEAVRGLAEVDRLYVSSKQNDLTTEMEAFNARLSTFDAPLAKVLSSMSRCSFETLESALADQGTFEALLLLMMHRSEDVAMSAEDVLLLGTKAEDKADGLRLTFVKDFSVPILSLSSLSRQLAKLNIFGPMPRWTKIGITVLEILCDRTRGVLTSELEGWERSILRVHWEMQWRCLGAIFKRCRKWALSEDKAAMIEFLRNTMDYAETLFDKFWTYEQALCASLDEIKGSREDIWTHNLLQDASKILNPFTHILSIQDEHLLQTGMKLMCKILGLLAEKGVSVADQAFFGNLKQYLYPEAFPGYDPTRATHTNLSEAQKTELAVFANRLCRDFIPVKEKPVIVISDEEYGDLDIPDKEEMPKAASEPVGTKTRAKLDFQPAPYSHRLATASKPAPKISGDPMRTNVKQRDPSAVLAFLEKRKAEKAALQKKKDAILKTKPKTRVLGDSSSDEDSSDGGGSALFKLGTRTKTEVKDKVAEAPRKSFVRKLPVMKHTKDNRARLAPDMAQLYKQIFKWDFFHDDAFPPGLSSSHYTSVPKTFGTFGAYQKTFEPLLLLEAWQSFLKSKEEAMPSGCLEVKIASRMRSDHFVDLETSIENMSDRNRWFEADVVLLSSSKDPLINTGGPHCIARVNAVMRKLRTNEISLRCEPGPAMLQNHMRTGGTLYGIKIMSLTPLEREYAALMCMQFYDLREEILTAKPSPLVEPTEAQVEKTKSIYNVNEPQAKAILSAVSGTGFNLIQGPPGTGKTKTVVGIVGALLASESDTIPIPGTSSSRKPPTKKVLVCAPSNAAVDELVIRFMQGLQSPKGGKWIPKIVRLGKSDAINAAVKDVTLEVLVDNSMQPTCNAAVVQNLDDLRQQHTKACAERVEKQKALDDARAQNIEHSIGLLAEIDTLCSTIRDLRSRLDQQRDQKKEIGRNAEILRRQCQQRIMNESQIICATLSGAGHEMLRNINVDFETVIIDEAAQSVELSALIPLKFGCEKCILVGDPQQLPPTVLSRDAARFSYEKSLFVRMQENYPKRVHLLSIQYRMHPAISAFPSRSFYDSGLLDGKGMAELRKQPWHSSTVFGPYRFFNVAGSESRQKTSLYNAEEARTALALFQRITGDFAEVNFDGRIGIVTPYKQQLGELKRTFIGHFGDKILSGVEFNTVDAFQGRERDIIIFSCVRAAEEGGVGFLSDIRRMNVGLTRSKSSLFILGNANFLIRNHMWRSLIEDAKERGSFTGNVHGLFGRSTRLSSRQIAAPPTVSNGGHQQVATDNWDPMELDTEVPVKQPQPTRDPRQNPDTMDIDIPTGPRGRDNQGPPRQRQIMNQRPQGGNQPQSKDANINCNACGVLGHRYANCPTRQGLNRPTVPPPQLKRPAQFDDEHTSKRKASTPGVSHGNSSASSSHSPMPAAAPAPASKGVVHRRSGQSDVLIRRKPKRPPGSRPPNP